MAEGTATRALFVGIHQWHSLGLLQGGLSMHASLTENWCLQKACGFNFASVSNPPLCNFLQDGIFLSVFLELVVHTSYCVVWQQPVPPPRLVGWPDKKLSLIISMVWWPIVKLRDEETGLLEVTWPPWCKWQRAGGLHISLNVTLRDKSICYQKRCQLFMASSYCLFRHSTYRHRPLVQWRVNT